MANKIKWILFIKKKMFYWDTLAFYFIFFKLKINLFDIINGESDLRW